MSGRNHAALWALMLGFSLEFFCRGILPEAFDVRAETSIPKAVPLEVSCTLVGLRQTVEGNPQEFVVRDGEVLHSGDNLKVLVKTNEDCHVYLLLMDSKGSPSQLFPHPKISLDNRIRGGSIYEIPPGDGCFWLDEDRGTETLYLLASYHPMTGLAEILRELERADDSFTKGPSADTDREVEPLTRGPQRSPRRPPKPIRITGAIGHSQGLPLRARGMRGGNLEGGTPSFPGSTKARLPWVKQAIGVDGYCMIPMRFEHQ